MESGLLESGMYRPTHWTFELLKWFFSGGRHQWRLGVCCDFAAVSTRWHSYDHHQPLNLHPPCPPHPPHPQAHWSTRTARGAPCCVMSLHADWLKLAPRRPSLRPSADRSDLYQYRRYRGDMIELFEILKGIYDPNCVPHFDLVIPPPTRSSGRR